MQSDSLSATEEETTMVNLGYIKVISLLPGIPFPNIYRYSFSFIFSSPPSSLAERKKTCHAVHIGLFTRTD
jgi:hypothetical protein